MINKTLLAELKEELENHIPDFLEEFNLLSLDEEKFACIHKETNIKLAIDYSHNKGSRSIYSAARRVLLSLDKKNIERENKTLDLYEDCGFVSKKQKYSEFHFRYDSLYYENPGYEFSFNIGEIEIEISDASSLYKLVFNSFTYDKNFYSWSDFKTIKLRGCQHEEIEKIMHQALFLIDEYEAPEFVLFGDYPNILPYEYHGEGTKWNDPDESKELDEFLFIPSKYFEPIAFFNKARRLDDPIFYYRTIEFFFMINKKAEIKRSVEVYIESNDSDKLIKDLSTFYGTKELELLNNLINNLDNVEDIIMYANNHGIIDSIEISTFSTKLYNYRNSIVHGKGDSKFFLNIPKIEILHPDSKDRYWNEVLRRLAYEVIKQFCF